MTTIELAQIGYRAFRDKRNSQLKKTSLELPFWDYIGDSKREAWVKAAEAIAIATVDSLSEGIKPHD
jgi:hypothetical protein